MASIPPPGQPVTTPRLMIAYSFDSAATRTTVQQQYANVAAVSVSIGTPATEFEGTDYITGKPFWSMIAHFSTNQDLDTVFGQMRAALNGTSVIGKITRHLCPHANGETEGWYPCTSGEAQYQEFLM